MLGVGVESLLHDAPPFSVRFDYACVSQGTVATAVLDFPQEPPAEAGFMPHPRHPSDHMPTGVQVQW